MQSFAGQGKGVGRLMVQALRQRGITMQDPTLPAAAAAAAAADTAASHVERQPMGAAAAVAGGQGTQGAASATAAGAPGAVSVTTVAAAGPPAAGESSRGAEQGAMEQQQGQAEGQQVTSGDNWLVVADAPMENARPFWTKMSVPVSIEAPYIRCGACVCSVCSALLDHLEVCLVVGLVVVTAHFRSGGRGLFEGCKSSACCMRQ